MIRAIARAAAHQFSRRYDYPVPHLERMIDLSPGTFLRYSAASSLARITDHIPLDASHAARITAVRVAGCTACLELSRSLAIEDGIHVTLVDEIAYGDASEVGDDASLATLFASSIMHRDKGLSAYREKVNARWGPDGLLELVLAVEFSRMHPEIKHALGIPDACTTQGGEPR